MNNNSWKILLNNRAGQIGLFLLLIIVLLAVAAPWVTQYAPEEYTGNIFSPPSNEFLLGTNNVGQDVWSRTLYGARTSLLVGISVGLCSIFFSLLIGSLAVIVGGRLEQLLLRFVDILLVIPPVLLVILVASYARPSFFLLIILLSSILWPHGARVVRAQMISLKERLYINVPTIFGAREPYIYFKHILPDLVPVMLALMVQYSRTAILMEAGLSFLGISDPSVVSWGRMMQQAMKFIYLDVWKWCLIPPGIALSLTIIGLSFGGYAVETFMNPRFRKGDSYVSN